MKKIFLKKDEMLLIYKVINKVNGYYAMSIDLDLGLKERLEPLVGSLEVFFRALRSPPKYLYVRINTLRISTNRYKSILRRASIDFTEDEKMPEVIGFEIKGPYPIEKENGYKTIIVDKKAAESVMLGSDLFAPGVKFARKVKKGDKVVILAPNGVPVAKGTALMNENEIVINRRGLAVKVSDSIYKTVKIAELPGASKGFFYAQSLPSMVAIRMLEPKPGEIIIDFTAAPGGKIGYVAQLVGTSSRILAIDRKSKVDKLRANLNKLGISWIKIMAGDSREIDKLVPSLKGKVDKIIIDPPCSNLGVRPKIFEKKLFREVLHLMIYQRSFLRAAKVMLRKGGRILYSTCTVTWEENELNIEYAKDLGFHVIDPPNWVKKRWYASKWGVRFCPIRHNLPGFFATVLGL